MGDRAGVSAIVCPPVILRVPRLAAVQNERAVGHVTRQVPALRRARLLPRWPALVPQTALAGAGIMTRWHLDGARRAPCLATRGALRSGRRWRSAGNRNRTATGGEREE